MLQHQIRCCTVAHQIYSGNLTVVIVDEHRKLCISSLTQKFIRYYTLRVVVGRMKECVKSKSLALAGQYVLRRERANTNREFSSTFHLLVLTCASSLGLSSPLSIGAPTFWLSLHCPDECSLTFLPHHISEPTNFQTLLVLLLPPCIRERTYLFLVILHQRGRFGASVFF